MIGPRTCGVLLLKDLGLEKPLIIVKAVADTRDKNKGERMEVQREKCRRQVPLYFDPVFLLSVSLFLY